MYARGVPRTIRPAVHDIPGTRVTHLSPVLQRRAYGLSSGVNERGDQDVQKKTEKVDTTKVFFVFSAFFVVFTIGLKQI